MCWLTRSRTARDSPDSGGSSQVFPTYAQAYQLRLFARHTDTVPECADVPPPLAKIQQMTQVLTDPDIQYTPTAVPNDSIMLIFLIVLLLSARPHQAIIAVVVVIIIIIITITIIANESSEPGRTAMAFQIAVRGQIVPRFIVARA